MEKQPSIKPQPPQPQLLAPQEVDVLIDDFQTGHPTRRARWISPKDPTSLLDLVLHALLRRDFPAAAKVQLLSFLDEFSLSVVPDPLSLHAAPALSSIIEGVRAIVQGQGEGFPNHLKEQAIICAASVAIAIEALQYAHRQLESLVDLLLNIINRPNYGSDRHTRAVACECLRELENSFPCLLSEITGHLWTLCQSERTHASQSYILLLTSVVHNIVTYGGGPVALSTAVRLTPFNVPSHLKGAAAGTKTIPEQTQALGDGNAKEVRKVIAFLVEMPQLFTPLATMELVSLLMGVVSALEMHGSVAALLKVQFSGLLYSYDPSLIHVVLMMYSHFSDAFAGDEQRIISRLSKMAKEAQLPLVFRLLALHWLLGLASTRPPDRKGLLVPVSSNFYPSVFDPLALKALKLDVLAYKAASRDVSSKEGKEKEDSSRGISVVKLIEDGLVCVSSFKWLPVDSTETSVAFRMLHRFLVEVAPHSDSPGDMNSIFESITFRTLQNMLVELALENQRLVSVISSFLDRLMGCDLHRLAGERLLQSMDELLLPMLTTGYHLCWYFPIFDRIGRNSTIPSHGLSELLYKLMVFLVEKHGPDTGLRSWSLGSKVLSICRTMLLSHPSSRVFKPLSRLLIFTCQFFPDLETRDNARIYLRVLLSVPGKKLRQILNYGNQVIGVSPSPHPGSLFQVPSPRTSRNRKVSAGLSSCIHIERVTPLLVKQSWSLTIPNWDIVSKDLSKIEAHQDSPPSFGIIPRDKENELNAEKKSSTQEPLRVVDSSVAEVLDMLRSYFDCIPDPRHMTGIKIKLPCTLRFDSEPFNSVWGNQMPCETSDGFDGLPALYASVIRFSSTSKYGSVPACRVPFLLGVPPGNNQSIVLADNAPQWDPGFQALVTVEIEPQEPMPGIIDVSIDATGENGKIISGSLQNIIVGIEDMFLRTSVPSNIPEDSIGDYRLDLFNALWEACGSSSSTGRETFSLKGGRDHVAIYGTRSVKLLDVSSSSVIRSVEQFLASFVVGVIGDRLIDAVRNSGVIRDAVWKEDSTNSYVNNENALVLYSESNSLQLLCIEDGRDANNQPYIKKTNLGCFLVLIFLPPRFHLLFQMEVSHDVTLVRIRTDHWPCLAYVDEYLEALFVR